MRFFARDRMSVAWRVAIRRCSMGTHLQLFRGSGENVFVFTLGGFVLAITRDNDFDRDENRDHYRRT
jgi:hypothetical protein